MDFMCFCRMPKVVFPLVEVKVEAEEDDMLLILLQHLMRTLEEEKMTRIKQRYFFLKLFGRENVL